MMLVEDEDMTREILAKILAQRYPKILLYTAINGRAGLELFKTHTPDVVITDINMPEMDGILMADKIDVIKSVTKFIFITGNKRALILQDSVEKGHKFDRLIMKPIDFQKLFAAIKQCFDEIALQQS